MITKLSELSHFLLALIKLKFPWDIHFLSNKEFHAKFCTEHEPSKLKIIVFGDPMRRKFKPTTLLLGGSAAPNAATLGSLLKHIFHT